jgi:coproporphyrinogen III oxidase
MKEEIVVYLKQLRDQIISTFEALEPTQKFERTPWNFQKGKGGGEMGVLRGDVFEKAAVNWSGIYGDQAPFNGDEGKFFATGVSLITHMKNPKMPTVHMNVRFIQTEKRYWFGGGYDLTPMGFPNQEDTRHFHQVAKETLDRFDPALYPLFSENARAYFFIPHWKKERGVGGIFFDHYSTENPEKDLRMWKEVGHTFLKAIMPIYKKRLNTPYTEEEKKHQNQLRAHYVEFNLLYDRGTKFGFSSGGNPQAILCSMPPTAHW